MATPRPKIPMSFCERAFTIFFLLWGCLLIVDHFTSTAHPGLFYGMLEDIMPGSWWGTLLIVLGLARWSAFCSRSHVWRLRLSLLTFILLTIITTIAFLTRLYAATAPLTAFVAYVSFWCHSALRRDINLGL